MATAWGIVKARDPKAVDMTPLVNAMTYKQQQYNANVVKVQGEIDKYLSTDILRDVDKEYFQQRLGALVNYINDAGIRDWSRNDVVTDISGYLSQVLDKNTMAAISSTKALRKQQAEIEELKTKNPELYAVQNEAHAMMNLPAYLNSNKLGDVYRPLTYTPYTDVTKQVMELTKAMKDHGIEYVMDYNNVDGEGWFVRSDKYEVLSPEKVKEMLGAAFDQRALTQLAIDGWYKYRGYTDEALAKEYKGYMQLKADAVQERIDALTLSDSKEVNVSKEDKAKRDNLINSLKEQKKELESIDVSKVDRNTLSSNLHTSQFIDKWTGALSYQRLVDSKIEDTGFQIYKQKYKEQQDALRLELDKQKFDFEKEKFEWEKANGGSGKDGKSGKSGGTDGLFTTVEDSALEGGKQETFNDVINNRASLKEQAVANLKTYLNNPKNLQEFNKLTGRNLTVDQWADGIAREIDKGNRALTVNVEKVIGADTYAALETTRQKMIKYTDEARDLVKKESAAVIDHVRKTYDGFGSLESTFNGGALDKNGNITKDVNNWENAGKFTEINRLIASTNAQFEAGTLQNQNVRRRIIETEMVKLGVNRNVIDKIMKTHVVGGSAYKEGGFYRNPFIKVKGFAKELAYNATVNYGTDNGGTGNPRDDSGGLKKITADSNTRIRISTEEMTKLTPRNKVVIINTNGSDFDEFAYTLREALTLRKDGRLQNYEIVKGGNARIRLRNDGMYELEADVVPVGHDKKNTKTEKFELSPSYIPKDLQGKIVSKSTNVYSANHPMAIPISKTSKMVSNEDEMQALYKHKFPSEKAALKVKYMEGAMNPASPYFYSEDKFRQQKSIFKGMLANQGADVYNAAEADIKKIIFDKYTAQTDPNGDKWDINVYDSKGNFVATVSTVDTYTPTQYVDDLQYFIGTAINQKLSETLIRYSR